MGQAQAETRQAATELVSHKNAIALLANEARRILSSDAANGSRLPADRDAIGVVRHCLDVQLKVGEEGTAGFHSLQ